MQRPYERLKKLKAVASVGIIESMATSLNCALRPGTKDWWNSSVQAYRMVRRNDTTGGELLGSAYR